MQAWNEKTGGVAATSPWRRCECGLSVINKNLFKSSEVGPEESTGGTLAEPDSEGSRGSGLGQRLPLTSTVNRPA